MSEIALLGGSFDPPHVGHQMVCLWVLSTGRADAVWLVPTKHHPLDKTLTAFEHRRRMCELAADGFAPGQLGLCTIEAELRSPSRTLYTLQHLRARHPEHRFSLLVGADILHQRCSWYRFDEIERMVPIVVVGRPGYRGPPGSIELAAVSSTQVRQVIASGRDASALVPKSVLDYIHRHRLYRRS